MLLAVPPLYSIVFFSLLLPLPPLEPLTMASVFSTMKSFIHLFFPFLYYCCPLFYGTTLEYSTSDKFLGLMFDPLPHLVPAYSLSQGYSPSPSLAPICRSSAMYLHMHALWSHSSSPSLRQLPFSVSSTLFLLLCLPCLSKV